MAVNFFHIPVAYSAAVILNSKYNVLAVSYASRIYDFFALVVEKSVQFGIFNNRLHGEFNHFAVIKFFFNIIIKVYFFTFQQKNVKIIFRVCKLLTESYNIVIGSDKAVYHPPQKSKHFRN